jgi:transposase
MYIEKVPNRNSPPCILLREASRDGKKIVKKTIANLSKWPEHIVEGLSALLKGGTVLENIEDSFDIIRSLPHGHVAAVLNSLRKLGIDKIIQRKAGRMRNIVVAMIVARIIEPRSKLATARGLDSETAFSSLAEECDIETIDEDELYEAMDWLLQRQESIERSIALRHLQDGTLVLYDLTSTYFEGKTCPLARRGHSRDNKQGKLQIEFGLLCDVDGRPIAVEVFEGNTGDPATVASQINKLRDRFGLKRVVMVGDRGMLTEARIREEFKTTDGLDWISALRAPAIKKLIKNNEIQPSLFDIYDLAEITSPDYPGERLMVCRNPLLDAERKRKRENLLRATEDKLQKVVKATQRKRNPLRGKDNIGVRVGKILNSYKVGKHFELNITDESFLYERREQKIREESALDGIYVIRTSVSADVLNAEETVKAYKGLSVAERAFRSLKSVDLKVRPIHHRLADRVRAHVFLCMLAYYVEWHMRQRLAPILFDDEDKEIADGLRKNVVAPAQRSAKAKRKATLKRTEEDDLPVHSFQTLLADLATIVKNRIQPLIPDSPTFDKLTTPTHVQQKALDLLGVRL